MSITLVDSLPEEKGGGICVQDLTGVSKQTRKKKSPPSVPVKEQAEKEHVNFPVPSHIGW